MAKIRTGGQPGGPYASGVGTAPVSSVSSGKLAYWQDMAALLDPLAYVWTHGASLSLTVPANKRWYVRNAFALLTADSRTDTGCAVTNGNLYFLDPTIAAADVGRYVFGTGISGGTFLESVAVTTIAAGSNAAALPQATINVASVAGLLSNGKALVVTDAGPQVVSYTSLATGQLLGCTGGTGTMSTGGAVTQATMSTTATATNTGLSVQVFGQKYMRDPSLDKAQMLPAGEVLTGAPSGQPYAYVCQPELVIPSPYGTGSDQRYVTDPEALFYSRLQSLRSMTPFEATALVAPNAAAGTNATFTFPTDFTCGLVMGVSSFRAAWVGLLQSTIATLNLMHEVNDNHEFRFAHDNMLLPFPVATFDKFKVQGASVPGDLTTPVGAGQGGSNPSFSSQGTLRYFKLPGGW